MGGCGCVSRNMTAEPGGSTGAAPLPGRLSWPGADIREARSHMHRLGEGTRGRHDWAGYRGFRCSACRPGSPYENARPSTERRDGSPAGKERVKITARVPFRQIAQGKVAGREPP
jgi:hypothetical protein